MKFYLVDGEVKFLTHKVEWQEVKKVEDDDDVITTHEMGFYDVSKKDTFVAQLVEREITPILTEIEQPAQEQIDKVEGRRFETIADVQKAIDGTEDFTKDDIMQSMALAIAELHTEILQLKGDA